MIDSIGALPLAQAARSAPVNQKTEEAAGQFEALLIGQLLKSSMTTSSEDQAGVIAIEMAQEHLAGAIASQGGLGLAHMITTNLEREAAAVKTPKP
jgi:Rod binding domain-containing protein